MTIPEDGGPRWRRIGARAARLLVVIAAIVAGGGLAAIAILGPDNVRWLMQQDAANLPRPRGVPSDLQGSAFLGSLRRGVILAEARQYLEALEALNEAVRTSPNTHTIETLGARAGDSTLPETHLWTLDIQARTARANVLQRLGRYEDALIDWDYALYLNERNTANRQQRGVARMMAGRFTQAIQDFDLVLARRSNLEAMFARGLAKFLNQDWQGAAADFAIAARRDPDSRKFAAWLGEAEAQLRQPATPVRYVDLKAENIPRALSGREIPANGVMVPLQSRRRRGE